jgi:hypothetical protein
VIFHDSYGKVSEIKDGMAESEMDNIIYILMEDG